MTEVPRWIARLWIPLLFLGCQIPFLLQPLGGLHKWRQADTAAVARNLAFESADPLHPRIDMRGSTSGITGMEFPLYQLAVAGGLRMLGDHDWIGKAVSLLAAGAAWLSLAALLVRRFAVDRISAHAALAVSPLLFSYAAKVMPETTALALACVAVERTDAWIASKRTRDLILAAAALACASLVRPYVVFAGVPLLLAWCSSLLPHAGWQNRRPLGWDVAAAGICAAVPFLWWYYVWCPELVRTYGIDYFFRGKPLHENAWLFFQPSLWGLLATSLAQHVVNWIALPAFLLGVWALSTARRRGHLDASALWITAGIPAFAIPALILLIGTHFSPHHYYFYVLIIPTAACTAAGINWVRRSRPRLAAWLLPLVIIASMAQWTHAWRADRGYRAYDPLIAQGWVPDGGLVAIEDGGHLAWHLHPLRARGWIVSRAAINDPPTLAKLGARGLRWIIHLENGSYHVSEVQSWFPHGRSDDTGSIWIFPPLPQD